MLDRSLTDGIVGPVVRQASYGRPGNSVHDGRAMSAKAILYGDQLAECYVQELVNCSAFHIATACLGIGAVRSLEAPLREAVGRGVSGRFLIGLDLPTDPAAIARLKRLADGSQRRLVLRILRASDRAAFHAKFALFERKRGKDRALVSSANFTERGLLRNLEASVLLDDGRCVGALRGYFDELFAGGRSRPVTEDWLARYERAWRRAKPKELPPSVNVPPPRPGPPRIKGYKFVFTGAVPGWPRDTKLYPLVERYGGFVAERAGSMRSVACLVQGEFSGDRKVTEKLVKAHATGVPVISVEDFFETLEREKRLRRRG
jgi:HKD family nuclease